MKLLKTYILAVVVFAAIVAHAFDGKVTPRHSVQAPQPTQVKPSSFKVARDGLGNAGVAVAIPGYGALPPQVTPVFNFFAEICGLQAIADDSEAVVHEPGNANESGVSGVGAESGGKNYSAPMPKGFGAGVIEIQSNGGNQFFVAQVNHMCVWGDFDLLHVVHGTLKSIAEVLGFTAPENDGAAPILHL